jgi:hypothetical protein
MALGPISGEDSISRVTDGAVRGILARADCRWPTFRRSSKGRRAWPGSLSKRRSCSRPAATDDALPLLTFTLRELLV